MSEDISSYGLAWDAAHKANRIFGQTAGTEAEAKQLAAEFARLQTIASVVFSPTDKEIATREEALIFQGRLTMPIEQLFGNLALDPDFKPAGTARAHTRAFNTLGRENVRTLLHLIIVGREAISDTGNVGDTGISFLSDIVHAVKPKLVWPAYAEAPYAARFCSSEDDIPARAIDPLFNYDLSVRTGINTLSDLLKASVHDFVVYLREKYRDRPNNDVSILAEARMLHRNIHNFAALFARTRREIGGRAGKTAGQVSDFTAAAQVYER